MPTGSDPNFGAGACGGFNQPTRQGATVSAHTCGGILSASVAAALTLAIYLCQVVGGLHVMCG